MARNKYPEETINLILDVSMRLFLEKGYENTTIQDIINGLGGLTKGAIYHHFKSKEDIMLMVMERLYGRQQDGGLESILEDNGSSALERLKKLIHYSLNHPIQIQMFTTAPNLLKNPKMLAYQMQSVMSEAIPGYVQPLIEQGIEDGSIKTGYPRELAELCLLLFDLWLNPVVFYAEPEAMRRRFRLFQEILLGIGVDLLDDSMLHKIEEFSRICSKKNRQ